MRALATCRAAPGLELTDVPEPTVGINDVLVRVTRTGVCGTDLHIRAWDEWARGAVEAPLVVGHEFVGRVVTAFSSPVVRRSQARIRTQVSAAHSAEELDRAADVLIDAVQAVA